jgi:SAM-dependent methyltransferase
MTDSQEVRAVTERYARRTGADARYSLLRPEVWQMMQERQRAMLRLFVRRGMTDLGALRVVEVGCGSGGNLLELLRLGFRPEHLQGAELLPERLAQARALLPPSLQLHGGDASSLVLPEAGADIVFVSTVFSSLLDEAFQQKLADVMWRWVRPGGGVLWYDFVYDNPANPDVRGVPLRRLRALFPHGSVHSCRVTLAPPIARRVVRLHPSLYTALNTVPWLRTHVLAWVAKP